MGQSDGCVAHRDVKLLQISRRWVENCALEDTVGGEMAGLLANVAVMAMHIVVPSIWWSADVDLDGVVGGFLVEGTRGGEAPRARDQSGARLVGGIRFNENGCWLIKVWRTVCNGIGDRGEDRGLVDVLIL